MSGHWRGAARSVAMFGLLLALLTFVPAESAHAAGHHPSGGWTGTATIDGWDHGRWRHERFLTTEQAVRAVLVFHPKTAAWSDAGAVMVVRHFTWDGLRPTTQAPVLRLRMRRRVLGAHTVVFTAVTRLPLLLPVYFSFVDFELRSGSLRGRVRWGISVMPPMTPTLPALSVPQAFGFCARTPRTRHGLPYGVVLQGYYYNTPAGVEGVTIPGEILTKPGYIPPPRLPRPLPGKRGILTEGFVLPPDGQRIPIAGILRCSREVPGNFFINGYGPRLDHPPGTNWLLILLVVLVALGIAIGVAMLPPVADHLGYARPLGRLPSRIGYRDRQYHREAISIPLESVERTVGDTLVKVGRIPTLLGQGHALVAGRSASRRIEPPPVLYARNGGSYTSYSQARR